VLAAFVELDHDVLDRQLDDIRGQLAARLWVVLGEAGGHGLEVTLDAAPEGRQGFGATLDEEREGIGDEVLDVLEVVGGGGQRHAGLGGHGTVAYGADAIAHDDPQGGVEDRLAALLAALAAGLAALVFDTFGDGAGDLRGTVSRGHWGHGHYLRRRGLMAHCSSFSVGKQSPPCGCDTGARSRPRGRAGGRESGLGV